MTLFGDRPLKERICYKGITSVGPNPIQLGSLSEEKIWTHRELTMCTEGWRWPTSRSKKEVVINCAGTLILYFQPPNCEKNTLSVVWASQLSLWSFVIPTLAKQPGPMLENTPMSVSLLQTQNSEQFMCWIFINSSEFHITTYFMFCFVLNVKLSFNIKKTFCHWTTLNLILILS